MSIESIKSKIAALLAKAEGTDNAFEAESFMAKVNELLEKHQIEMHEIRNRAGQDSDPIDFTVGGVNLYASMSWAKDLAGTLARYYGCRFILWRNGNHFKYEIAGRESARITFELMLPFVITQVKLQAKALASEKGGTRSVWERQVGHALWVRVNDLLPKVEEHRESLEKNALVPVSDLQSVVEEKYPNLKKGRNRSVRFGNAASDAAAKVSLHHQATGKHTKLIA